MLKRLPPKYTPKHTYEDLFLERYDQLLAWAIRLTDHDLQQAEDLVHDVFVKFAMTQPDLHRIENLDAYLYTAFDLSLWLFTKRDGQSRQRFDTPLFPRLLPF
jgi:DNA-directed RNA polymerase specialized sigma24 family protein